MSESIDTSLLAKFHAGLSEEARPAVEACIRLARERGVSIYLVGGAVRDLILGRDGVDVDLAVETEDVAALNRQLTSEIGGRAVTHAQFGTAVVKGPGFRLDLARTRSETYARPGALPVVHFASLQDDLSRRDFTVNAMALRLTEPAGELIDPTGGQRDIESRLIRVLHEGSFRDDATRILRAVRYVTRLVFRLESQTETWLKRDLPSIDTISGPRLRRELAVLFEESTAVQAARLARDLGVLSAIRPQLSLDDEVANRWQQALDEPFHPHIPADEAGFCVLTSPSEEDEVASVSTRLHLSGRYERALTDLVHLRSSSDKLVAGPASALDVLDNVALSAIAALSILDAGAVGKVCETYLSHWRRVKPHLTGRDVIAQGVQSGPAVGEALRELRMARIEGRAQTRDDEIALLQQLARKG